MNIQNNVLFGFPVMSTTISKKTYNKKDIISTIEKNFKISNKRNNWDNKSVLHHSADDWNNSKYHKINFESILPVYKKTIGKMLTQLKIGPEYSFEFEIANYTCLSNTNFMLPHLHPDSDFAAVHYIQFDKKNHTATKFINTSPYVDYIRKIRPELFKVFSSENFKNSWAFGHWVNAVEEDDFYCYPSYLKHEIEPQISKDKKRITIAININLKTIGKR